MPKYDEFDLDLQTSKIDDSVHSNEYALSSIYSCASCTCVTAYTCGCGANSYGCGSGSNGGVCSPY